MNLDEMADSIREGLNGVEKKINDLTKQKGNDRQESANKLQKRLNGTKNLLNHYKFAIDEAIDDDGIDSHKSQHKELVFPDNGMPDYFEMTKDCIKNLLINGS